MDSKNCNQLYSQWAAVATVAGALERKVWLQNAIGKLYPNFFIILVGDPGTGKTTQTDVVQKLWGTLTGPGPSFHKLALSSVNHASIVDELVDAKRVANGITFNSLLMAVNELSVLMPSYDPNLHATLIDLYDCKVVSQRRRTSDIRIEVEHPQANLIAATQPSTLNQLIPAAVWDQGFITRVLLIYNNQRDQLNLWLDPSQASGFNQLWHHLATDLAHISKLFGEARFLPEVQEAVSAWEANGGKPKPTHPRLEHYCARRVAHLLKLSMVVSAARNDSLVVELDDWETALSLLTTAEASLPSIFRSMQRTGDERLIKELWYAVRASWEKHNKRGAVGEEVIVRFLSERTSPQNVIRTLEIAVRANYFQRVHTAKGYAYTPLNEPGD